MHFIDSLFLVILTLSCVQAIPHGTPTLPELVERKPTPTSILKHKCPKPIVPLGGGGPRATVKGRLFQIQSKKQYFAGTNTWWLGHLQSDQEVDQTLSQLALSQIKTTRVWGFGNVNDASTNPSYNTYFQVLNSSGVYLNCDPVNGLPRLDYAISAAEAKGVKIVLPLLNNFEGLGGIETYTTAFGGDHNSFFTNPQSQAAFKAYVEFIVNRYKKSPAIFSWELSNEIRCSGCPSSVITNWASDISAFIKSIDNHHMVALGDEGWLVPPAGDGSYPYSGYEGVDFAANLAIPTIDYGTFHLYPEYWTSYQGQDAIDFGNRWIVQHNDIGRQANKPVVLEEYGSADANKTIRMDPWQQTVLQNTSIASDMFWQFGTQLQSANPFDGYALFYDTTPGGDYDTLVTRHAPAMLAKRPVANQ